MSGLFGIALFLASARPISTAIHLCVFILLIFCSSYNYWLASPLILFFSDVCLSDSHRLEQFLAATTRIIIYFNDAIRLASQPQSRVCEMAQSLHVFTHTSTYSHTQARTHQDELCIHYNAKGLPKRMQLGSQRQKIYKFES